MTENRLLGDRLPYDDDTAIFAAAPPRSAMPAWYPELFSAVAQRVATGRQRAIAVAHEQLLVTYWGIGSDILARQNREGWGARVIDRMAADLRERFPGTQGHSARNLGYMRAFAAAWPDPAVVQRLAQLPWSHQIALLEKLDEPELRLRYAAAAIEGGWTRAVLVHHIECGRYRRSADLADSGP